MNNDLTNNYLTKHQIQTFQRQGYLRIPQAVPVSYLSQIKQDSDNLIHCIYQQLKQGCIHPDHAFTCRYFQSYLNRIGNFHHHAAKSSLTILGSQLIQNIANQLCHPQHIVSFDMMIIKNLGDELDIPWHQDIIFNQNIDQIIAVGIYLEPATINDGALTLIPNSQHQQHNIQELTDDNGRIQYQQLQLEAQAGDIIIHHPMLIHRSAQLKKQPIRRTLYYEFRNLSSVLDLWSPQIVNTKLHLEKQAIRQYKKTIDRSQHVYHNLCC